MLPVPRRLGDAAVVELCQAMIDMGDQCNIWRLDLQTCCINDLGLEAVSETLAQCPSLQARPLPADTDAWDTPESMGTTVA